jgi:hypothetical protein
MKFLSGNQKKYFELLYCEEKELLHRKVSPLYVSLVKRNSTQQRRSNE